MVNYLISPVDYPLPLAGGTNFAKPFIYYKSFFLKGVMVGLLAQQDTLSMNLTKNEPVDFLEDFYDYHHKKHFKIKINEHFLSFLFYT